MLTACVHAGCLCFRNREGRFNNVKNESGLLLEFHFYMDSIEYEVYCQGGVTDVVVEVDGGVSVCTPALFH